MRAWWPTIAVMGDIERLHTNSRMSQAVIHGDTVYLAGQVAADNSADVAGQTKQILQQIDGLLAESGSDKAKILMATIWLSDIDTFDQMNREWDAWVPEGDTPARACVESRLANEAYKVEIRVVAGR
jgi:enamine deaminase RidA (YjgF/YER057c/UK114 family)